MTDTVAAVVVTYNRATLLIECLDALLRQTRHLEKIILIDNASTDGTKELLATKGYLRKPQIDYIELPSNTGGAGGFNEGVRRGFAAGMDWLWVMDDDAEPLDDALEEMSKYFGRAGIAGVANLPVDVEGQTQSAHRGWLRLNTSSQDTHTPITADPVDATEISFASFVGLAISRRAIETIGIPMKELFIHGDDLEYCTRLSKVGPIILASRSRIMHKDGMNTSLPQSGAFGRRSARVPFDKLWIRYYFMRNHVWLRRDQCGDLAAAAYVARRFPRLVAGILLYDRQRLRRMRFFWNAIADGWAGRFDNDKPRRLTRA